MNDPVYRPNEVPPIWKISRSQLFRLMAEGKIASSKIGRSRYIRASELERFFRDLEEQA